LAVSTPISVGDTKFLSINFHINLNIKKDQPAKSLKTLKNLYSELPVLLFIDSINFETHKALISQSFSAKNSSIAEEILESSICFFPNLTFI